MENNKLIHDILVELPQVLNQDDLAYMATSCPDGFNQMGIWLIKKSMPSQITFAGELLESWYAESKNITAVCKKIEEAALDIWNDEAFDLEQLNCEELTEDDLIIECFSFEDKLPFNLDDIIYWRGYKSIILLSVRAELEDGFVSVILTEDILKLSNISYNNIDELYTMASWHILKSYMLRCKITQASPDVFHIYNEEDNIYGFYLLFHKVLNDMCSFFGPDCTEMLLLPAGINDCIITSIDSPNLNKMLEGLSYDLSEFYIPCVFKYDKTTYELTVYDINK